MEDVNPNLKKTLTFYITLSSYVLKQLKMSKKKKKSINFYVLRDAFHVLV